MMVQRAPHPWGDAGMRCGYESFIAPSRSARSRAASPCTGGLLSQSFKDDVAGRVGVGASSDRACGQCVAPVAWLRTGAKALGRPLDDAVWRPKTETLPLREPLPASPGEGREMGAVAKERALPAPALASGDAWLGADMKRVPLTPALAGALVMPAGGAGAGGAIGGSAIAPPRRRSVPASWAPRVRSSLRSGSAASSSRERRAREAIGILSYRVHAQLVLTSCVEGCRARSPDRVG
mmetsp:Transcript_20139/g.62563  ORF Transcript_20139/g.62563 Transcript_20139/m.62563 type:complete len:237 (-) Transcript_20139:71-781(-)